VSGVSNNKEDEKMPKKIKDIGKPDAPGNSREHRLHGGETWAIINNPSGVFGLVLNDRLRVEIMGNKATMYPDVTTDLYKAGYEEIELNSEQKHPPAAYDLWSYTALKDGAVTTLYLAEGSDDNPAAEAEIWIEDPRAASSAKSGKGGGGGTAGLRR
jgi:hypothetical protein